MPPHLPSNLGPAPPQPPTGETKDGSGAGDHDVPYTFGFPTGFLTTRDQVRLLVMRGFVRDVRNGEYSSALGAAAALGDISGDPTPVLTPIPIPIPEILSSD